MKFAYIPIGILSSGILRAPEAAPPCGNANDPERQTARSARTDGKGNLLQ
jgi:hypothetical protein